MEDQWLADYEAAQQTAKETLQLIQASRWSRRRASCLRCSPRKAPLLSRTHLASPAAPLSFCQQHTEASKVPSPAGAQSAVPRGRPRGQPHHRHLPPQAGHARGPAGWAAHLSGGAAAGRPVSGLAGRLRGLAIARAMFGAGPRAALRPYQPDLFSYLWPSFPLPLVCSGSSTHISRPGI